MKELARERGVNAVQMALLWCKDQPGVTTLFIGPCTLAQLEELLPVLDMTLNDQDRPVFDNLVHPGSAVSDFQDSVWWMKARV